MRKFQNAYKRRCFRTLSAICILTRLPRASISWWRWTLVRYLGYFPLQIPDGSCDFSFSIACIINQLCDFVKWILKKFFGQAWKRLACEGRKRAEMPLTASERTRAIGIWPDIHSWTPADRTGHGRTFWDKPKLTGSGFAAGCWQFWQHLPFILYSSATRTGTRLFKTFKNAN